MSSILRTVKYSFIRHPLQEIFGAPSLIAILRVLNQISQGLSGREVARRSGINDRTCRLALKRLETVNLIENLGSGKTKLFRLNRANYFAHSVLTLLFNTEKNYLDTVIEELGHYLKNKCIWSCIYGSVAKKMDTAASDLDILIIVNSDEMAEKLENEIQDLISKVYYKFGLSLTPLIFTNTQWATDNQFQTLKSDVQKVHIQISGDTN